MKCKFDLFIILILLSNIAMSQIKLYPNPQKGYEKRIKEYVNNLHVVDTHEHLRFQDSLGTWTSYDFMLLFIAYTSDDLVSAGMSREEYNSLINDSISVADKWKIIEPYWNKTKNTAYSRNTLMIAKEVYGVNDLNSSTVELLSAKIKEAYKNPNWSSEVFDKAKIDYTISDGFWIHGGGPWELKNDKIRFVTRFDEYLNLWSDELLKNLSKKAEYEIKTLTDLENSLVKEFDWAVKKGVVGVKCGMAYLRPLNFEEVSRENAEKVFNELVKQGWSVNSKQLNDYMMHQIIKQAEKNNLPMIFHTGLQAGNGNIIENSKPTHLVNLLRLYPKVNFVFYHGGFPYGGELTAIIKNFPNAWLDLSWLYIISPTYAKNYLHEWLEAIPANKIMAFGGDASGAEASYAHLVIAKQVVSQVLIEKVQTGYLKEQEAKDIAKMIFYDNAVNFYKLKN